MKNAKKTKKMDIVKINIKTTSAYQNFPYIPRKYFEVNSYSDPYFEVIHLIAFKMEFIQTIFSPEDTSEI